MEELEGYLTVQEAAQKMSRSTEQVRRYLREGKVAGRRIGGQWFIRETAVLYLTKEKGFKMASSGLAYPDRRYDVHPQERLELFERVNRRREDIGRRWEKSGIEVDVVEIIRELREET